MTKCRVNGFTEALRQKVTKRHVRVGVLEPGGVTTELMSHHTGTVREQIDHSHATTEPWYPRTSPMASPTWSPDPAMPSISELWIMPTDQI